MFYDQSMESLKILGLSTYHEPPKSRNMATNRPRLILFSLTRSLFPRLVRKLCTVFAWLAHEVAKPMCPTEIVEMVAHYCAVGEAN